MLGADAVLLGIPDGELENTYIARWAKDPLFAHESLSVYHSLPPSVYFPPF